MPAWNSTPQELQQKIIELYTHPTRVLTTKQVAEELGVGVGRVQKVLRRNNVPARTTRIPPEEQKRIIAWYRDDYYSAREIAAMTGRTQQNILRLLKRHGVETRSPGGNRKPPIPADEIRQCVFLHNVGGYSQRDIAIILKGKPTYQTWVKRRLIKGGVKLRGRGHAGKREIKRVIPKTGVANG